MSSLVSLLNGIVDYAGLFPPAALELDQVVCNYSEYQKTSQSWMLGRLVLPALQLSELDLSAAEFFPHVPPGWKISALVPEFSETEKFKQAIESIASFNQKHARDDAGLAAVDAIETRVASSDAVASVAAAIPSGIDVFFELDHRADPAELIQSMGTGERNGFAKIRTGGVTADLIPTVAEVARFIVRCAENGVGLKATAGLHHPIRSEFPLTYQTDSPRATMHGFINVFVAMMLAFELRLGQADVELVIAETDPDRFEFAGESIRWGEWTVESSAIERVRRDLAISFGSCSFEEPIQDLQRLGFGARLAEAI
jgi:hypothetical protein